MIKRRTWRQLAGSLVILGYKSVLAWLCIAWLVLFIRIMKDGAVLLQEPDVLVLSLEIGILAIWSAVSIVALVREFKRQINK